MYDNFERPKLYYFVEKIGLHVIKDRINKSKFKLKTLEFSFSS